MKKNAILKILIIGILIATLQIGVGITNRVFAEDNTSNTISEENTNTSGENTNTNTTEENTTTNEISNNIPEEPQIKSITTLRANINNSTHTYSGNARTPSVELFDGNTKLRQNVDYTVAYKNNTNVGKATIIVKGKGNYTGTITKYFYIAPKKAKITSVMFNSKFTKATVKWQKDSMATGYIIYMSTTKDGEYKAIKTITDNKTTSYTKSGLNANNLYYFKIRAYKIIDDKKICKLYSEPKSNTGLIAEITLNSPTSGSNRNYNLKLASKKINGTILKSGQIFNWFKVVGPASKAKGYKQAIVFSNGKSILGYGGGVCQVSTTIYQAAVKAKLKIVERHMHSKPVSYTTRGKDATVSYGVQNLRIKNNKKYSIRIVTTSNKGKTTCKLYRVAD